MNTSVSWCPVRMSAKLRVCISNPVFHEICVFSRSSPVSCPHVRQAQGLHFHLRFSRDWLCHLPQTWSVRHVFTCRFARLFSKSSRLHMPPPVLCGQCLFLVDCAVSLRAATCACSTPPSTHPTPTPALRVWQASAPGPSCSTRSISPQASAPPGSDGAAHGCRTA